MRVKVYRKDGTKVLEEKEMQIVEILEFLNALTTLFSEKDLADVIVEITDIKPAVKSSWTMTMPPINYHDTTPTPYYVNWPPETTCDSSH